MPPPPPPPDPSADSSLPQPCEVAGPAHDASGNEPEREELCVFLCDFLIDIPRRDSYQCWDAELIDRRGAAIFRCHLTEPNKYVNVNESRKNPVMDVRGLPVRQVVDALKHRVYYRSLQSASKPYPRYLKVIVGCQKHGIGQGKVHQEVVSWLKERNTIVWEENDNQSVISIRLDGWKNFEYPDKVSSDSDYYDSDVASIIKEAEEIAYESHTGFVRFLKDLENKEREKQ